MLLAGTLTAVYAPGFQGELIFDDHRLVDGTVFGSYGALFELKQRLLSYGSFVWIQQLLGEGWWKQRLINLLLHLGVAVLLFRLVRLLVDQVDWAETLAKLDERRLARSKDAAVAFGVAVFALNPAAAYAVSYLIQRSIVMAALFAVLSLYLTARTAQGAGAGFAVAAIIAYLAALFSKEHALFLPLVALAIFLMVRRPSRRSALLAIAAAVLACLAGAGFLAMRYGDIVGRAFDKSSQGYLAQLAVIAPGVEGQAHLLSIVNQSWLFFKYGLAWLVPYVGTMSVDIRPAFPLTLSSLPQVLGLALYPATLAGSVFLMVRFGDWRRIAGLGFFVPAVLFATEFATVWIQDPFVLYRSYLWAVGVPLLLAILFVGVRPAVVAIATVVLCGVLGASVVERVFSLRGEAAAWADAASKIDVHAPSNAVGRWRPFLNRGNGSFRRGMSNSALMDYELASRLGDPTGLAEYHRGLLLDKAGRTDDAIVAFTKATKSLAMPDEFVGLPHFELGKLHFRRGEFEVAAQSLDQAVAILRDQETRVAALKFRAQSKAKRGMSKEAISDYKLAVEQNPADRGTRIGYALALNGDRQRDAALAVLEEMRRERDDWDVRLGLVIVFDAMGRTDLAREETRAGLALNPADPNLGAFARKYGLKP